ncbi:probable inactive serine/threonine-protein kinase bub1 isoform X2 [Neltuma alba]|uniref:probable inactive serine/threonine-protein kinase bub1 isoform X2 n=1 Tax=Neltuma alba TaxID=207710 RepID=UPI0010A50D44|nr:probable inactive serine/threonine-protein kinase bub1 isoform X2 [Prosopis alba]XP_028803801.1 probable inactive serine/threonine-protein kinase bub1 isoform X2 [Prosopis alba]
MASQDLFTSLISDIETYSGKDPLLPWLRGIRKMKDTLSPAALHEKLPDFLQKCAQTFESDRRYRNDMRYLRVWLHLMDFVDDPLSLLKTMEVNHIGTKRCQFYQAYALYYEKNRRYDEAEKMYHLGVKNLAEPMDDLQKSYEQFLGRMERKKNRKIQQQEGRASRRPLSTKNIPAHINKTEGKGEACGIESKKDQGKRFLDEPTVVGKFVGTALVGRSEAENACHHGLVDPTINMKEAMNAINNMFREPLEDVPIAKKSHKNRSKEDQFTPKGLEVFIDESSDNGTKSSASPSLQHNNEAGQFHQEPLQIYIDDEGPGETSDINDEQSGVRNLPEDFTSSASRLNAFVFPRPKNLPSESSGGMDARSSRKSKFREDTVVRRFVGSTILDEPVVENVCHHGLVDPTINMKEAMNDINNMFGKPMDFVRRKRSMKQEKAPECNNRKECGGFSILADDDLENKKSPQPPKLAGKSTNSDLFEPTLITKEAMDDINKMFNMPLNF